MKLFILKTDIRTKGQMNRLKPVLEHQPMIKRWAIDIQDSDHVLKLETNPEAHEMELINLIKEKGFYCESLPE